MPRRRLPRKPVWDANHERNYAVSSWTFQKFIVRLFLLPFPVALVIVAYWFIWDTGNPPPSTAVAVLFGSIAGTLTSAFFFWRCPHCNRILFRSSDTDATELFWLGDPEHCPDCGIRLRKKRVTFK